MINVIRLGAFSFTLYDMLFGMGFVGVMVYLLLISKHYSMPILKTIVFAVLVYSSTVAWMFFLFWADSGFRVWGGNNIVRVFWWLGVFVFPVSKLIKRNYLECLDFVSPCLCINHGIAHFGCIFAGCCHGYPCDWGLYSNEVGYRCVPTQPIEALVALGIATFIWQREKNKGYGKGVDGLSFPIMLMIFGYSRFFLEFLRDNKKLFWGISGLAIHALVNGVIGTVAFFVIRNYNRKKQKVAV
jgi:phosphatidylglycerol:prolipoprotein diacylglycerol transferase